MSKVLAYRWLNGPDPQYGITTGYYGVLFWISKLLVEVVFVLLVVMGFGLIRLRRWAAVWGRFVGPISLGVCVWFILTPGEATRHRAVCWYLVRFVLSVYTSLATWRLGPYGRTTEADASAAA